MTQFFMAARKSAQPLPPGVEMRDAGQAELFRTVCDSYLSRSLSPQLVVEDSGLAAPLIDEVWEVLHDNGDIRQLRLVELAEMLFDQDLPFVLWCGSEFSDLPIVGSLAEFIREIEVQAAEQPADVFLTFPGGKPSAEEEVEPTS